MTTPLVGGVRIATAVVAAGSARRDAAWALLRGMLPPGAALSNPCPRCGGPHGPVRVAGATVRASVAYAGDLAVVGVADAGLFDAFGIDAERVQDATRDAAGLDGVLGTGIATLRDWTRVEAVLKADGRGLRVDPAAVTLRMAAEVDACTGFGWEAVVPGGDGYRGWDAEAPRGVLISVAVRLSAAAATPPGRATHAGAPGGPRR